MNLKEYLQKASETKTALGHFNVSNWEGIKAIKEICQETNAPMVIGVSQGEAEFIGVKEIATLVKFFRSEYNLPLFLNADHFVDLDMVEKAASAGFDSILFDAASNKLEENIMKTKMAVQLVKSINKEILVEGELGYIGVGSEIREVLPQGAVVEEKDMPTPEEAEKYVKETGVELIGPAVGNIHGIIKSGKESLNFRRIQMIKDKAGAFLVLHGASGISNEDVKTAIKSGINMVHFNTELRVAWKNVLEQSLKNNPKEVAPYKILASSVGAIKTVIKQKLAVFNAK